MRHCFFSASKRPPEALESKPIFSNAREGVSYVSHGKGILKKFQIIWALLYAKFLKRARISQDSEGPKHEKNREKKYIIM
jgi:hypothetical protein